MKTIIGVICLVICLLLTSCGQKLKFKCSKCNLEFNKCSDCGLTADEHAVIKKPVIHSCGGFGNILSADDK